MFSLQSSGYGGGVDTISTENDDNRARRGKDERLQKIQVTQPANISQPKYSLRGYSFWLLRLG